MKKLALVPFAFAFSACKPSSAPPPTTPATVSTPASAAVADAQTPAAVAASASPTPLPLTEDRLKQWMAYHKDIAALARTNLQAMAAANNSKDTSTLGKLKADSNASGNLQQGKADLQKKYGMTDEEDKAISDVVAEVAVDADAMGGKGAFDDLRKQAAGTGPQADGAKQILAKLDDAQKEHVAEAEKKYGKAAVDVVLAHKAEAAATFKDGATAAFGK